VKDIILSIFTRVILIASRNFSDGTVPTGKACESFQKIARTVLSITTPLQDSTWSNDVME